VKPAAKVQRGFGLKNPKIFFSEKKWGMVAAGNPRPELYLEQGVSGWKVSG
jgi:hypothetical protein